MRKLLSALALVAAVAAPVAIHATPITGQFSVGGTVTNSGAALEFMSGTLYSGRGTQTLDFAKLVPDNTPVSTSLTSIDFAPYICCTVFTVGELTTTLESVDYTTNEADGVMLYGFGGTALFHDDSGIFSDTIGTFGFSAQQTGPVQFSATGVPSPTTSPVPEPSTLALMGSGVLGLAGVVRRKFVA